MSETPDPSAVTCELTGAAESDAFRPIRDRLAELNVGDTMLRRMLTDVSEAPGGQDELLRLRSRLGLDSAMAAGMLFERYVLLRGALGAVSGVARLPVPEGVKTLMLEEFVWLTRPKDRELPWFTAGEYVFSALCKLVTFRRFSAGQLHWEVAGLSRSTLWRVQRRQLPALLAGVRALGGFRPTFVPHLAWRRRQIMMSEREHYRSLFLMTQALELQPQILGYVGEAWFYSPDAHRVSPHLAWTKTLFETWGGTVVITGAADESSGVFQGSRVRRELAERGEFRPTLGLAIWPRAGMRRWAASVRSEYGQPAEPEFVG